MDAINLEIIPEIEEPVKNILIDSFKIASDELGFKYPVHGTPHFGANQYETH
nr:MAG TPA: hypothetical protein [Caudoviricetes sp.]